MDLLNCYHNICLITLMFGAMCTWFLISVLCLSYLTWQMGLYCFFLGLLFVEKKIVCKVIWALSQFFYFPMRYLCFTSCIQMFCGIMLETTSSLTLRFFISSESLNQCFREDEASFCAGLSNTFLCPNQHWFFPQDTQRRCCTMRLFLLSVNSVHTK